MKGFIALFMVDLVHIGRIHSFQHDDEESTDDVKNYS